MATIDPFEILTHYDTAVRQVARKLPRQVLKTQWVGVEIRAGEQSFLAPLSSVLEIVSNPSITRVPGAQPWLVGVMNMRGSLVPVTDVAYWLTGKSTSALAKPRILVVEHNQELYGLKFHQILGMQRLNEVVTQPGAASLEGPLALFVSQTLESGGKLWPVLDLKRLLSQDTFYQTALVS